MLIFNYTKTLYIYGTFSTLKKCVLTSTVLFKSCWIPCEVRASVAKNSVNILYVKVKKKKSCILFGSATAFDFLPATQSRHKTAAVDKPDTKMTSSCKLGVKSLTLKLTSLSSNTESTAPLWRFSS